MPRIFGILKAYAHTQVINTRSRFPSSPSYKHWQQMSSTKLYAVISYICVHVSLLYLQIPHQCQIFYSYLLVPSYAAVVVKALALVLVVRLQFCFNRLYNMSLTRMHNWMNIWTFTLPTNKWMNWYTFYCLLLSISFSFSLSPSNIAFIYLTKYSDLVSNRVFNWQTVHCAWSQSDVEIVDFIQ